MEEMGRRGVRISLHSLRFCFTKYFICLAILPFQIKTHFNSLSGNFDLVNLRENRSK